MTALTLPATRRRLRGSVKGSWLIPRLLAEPALFAAALPYVFLRGVADGTAIPRVPFALSIDRMIGLGATPSERLQGWFYGGALSSFDWFWLSVHAAWFFMPGIITIYVIIFRWELFRSLATVRLLVLYVGLIGFFLFPTEPPWMATDVARLLDVKAGEVIATDTNPLAAFPSLHVALPAAIAMWLFRVRMNRWAAIFTVYVALTAFDVVYLGEHYVVDVVAGLLLAYAIVRVSGAQDGARPAADAEPLRGAASPLLA